MVLKISEHKNILFQILKDIYSDTKISPFLGFKGGTAAYIFYDLPRFSVDLDFDLLDSKRENDLLEKIKKIIKDYGRIKEAREKRFSFFFLLSYQEKSQNIKIEINKRLFGSEYEIKTYLGISMKVMKREDMFAHKLVAMDERMGKTNRDIYDAWFFAKNNWPVNKEIVGKRSNLDFGAFLQKCIISLEKIKQQNILQGIGELLNEKQKAWAKTHLKQDTIFLLKLMLENEGVRGS